MDLTLTQRYIAFTSAALILYSCIHAQQLPANEAPRVILKLNKLKLQLTSDIAFTWKDA